MGARDAGRRVVVGLTVLILLAGCSSSASPTPAAGGAAASASPPLIYDAKANPQADIDAAVAAAKADGRRVLIDFGADWCEDCTALAADFASAEVRPFLDANFHVVPVYAPGSPLPLQLLLAGTWAFAIVVGNHATISITDAAIKVRIRSLSNNVGWSVSLSEIESAQAIAARPEPLTFDRSRCVLRTGPALEIRTVTGGHYAVSLDEAGEAVAVIEALRSGAPPETP